MNHYKKKNENIIKHKSISLPVELFYQETNYWCGPASVQMVINYVANKKISQEKLANYLQTVKTGTYPRNIPAILNKFTNQNNHKYTRKILGLNYGLTEKEQKIFYNDVNNSLKHNFPVILSMHDKYPWNNHMIRHLIVIHGIQVSEKFEKYTYLIADPWSGEVEVKQSQISSLFTYDANSSIIKSN
ncbi:MAG: hypothetical protein SPLM_07860 [Spiroplasma phoeniceum]|uniref:C39 family peptidase n=1 Tax=Spiroplasma phoeniceum TaxID=47835 RepID=UPI0032892D1D